MTKIWQPLDMEVYKSWIEVIVTEASDELTEWETSFISSLHDRLFKYGKQLTEAQASTLERIYAEKTN